MLRLLPLGLLLTMIVAPTPNPLPVLSLSPEPSQNAPFLVVLGVAQDAGFPQAGTPPGPLWKAREHHRLAACLGLVEPRSGRRWMFEATPDFKEQLHRLDLVAPVAGIPGLDGIFLTHGHMGHYTGLLHLGREAIGAREVPVYAMPRMREFLSSNGPWDQLVRLENIDLRPLEANQPALLAEDLSVTPILVPHRDEYTETVGFVIAGPQRRALFLPDIDKWERWDERIGKPRSIEDWIRRVDVAYIDGSFFAEGEIPGRAMSEIPHPFIAESLERFASLPAEERAKIRFIHRNRTNPTLRRDSSQAQVVRDAGSDLAEEGERFGL